MISRQGNIDHNRPNAPTALSAGAIVQCVPEPRQLSVMRGAGWLWHQGSLTGELKDTLRYRGDYALGTLEKAPLKNTQDC